MDTYQIELQNVRIFAFHGFFPEERVLGNWYRINLKVKLKNKQLIDDQLVNTLDYGTLFLVCKEVMANSVDLLETVVETIFDRIVSLSNQIIEINLELSKENPPLGISAGNSSISRKWVK
jgi:dihydroneopterin aldolase